jgi:hypothetical protein
MRATQCVLPAIRAGAARCAERLSRICRVDWRVERLCADEEALPGIAVLLEGIAEDHYGSYCSVPGASFLVIFDRRSGLRVSNRFIGNFSDQFDLVEHLEAKALAEVSGILVNALVDGLPREDPEACLISVPEPLQESTRELLQAAFRRFGAREDIAMAGLARLVCPALHGEATLLILLAPALIERAILASGGSAPPQAGR